MSTKEAFLVFGLADTATWSEVRSRYKEEAVAWHPDRFEVGSQLHSRANEKLKALNLARDILRDYFDQQLSVTCVHCGHMYSSRSEESTAICPKCGAGKFGFTSRTNAPSNSPTVEGFTASPYDLAKQIEGEIAAVDVNTSEPIGSEESDPLRFVQYSVEFVVYVGLKWACSIVILVRSMFSAESLVPRYIALAIPAVFVVTFILEDAKGADRAAAITTATLSSLAAGVSWLFLFMIGTASQLNSWRVNSERKISEAWQSLEHLRDTWGETRSASKGKSNLLMLLRSQRNHLRSLPAWTRDSCFNGPSEDASFLREITAPAKKLMDDQPAWGQYALAYELLRARLPKIRRLWEKVVGDWQNVRSTSFVTTSSSTSQVDLSGLVQEMHELCMTRIGDAWQFASDTGDARPIVAVVDCICIVCVKAIQFEHDFRELLATTNLTYLAPTALGLTHQILDYANQLESQLAKQLPMLPVTQEMSFHFNVAYDPARVGAVRSMLSRHL